MKITCNSSNIDETTVYEFLICFVHTHVFLVLLQVSLMGTPLPAVCHDGRHLLAHVRSRPAQPDPLRRSDRWPRPATTKFDRELYDLLQPFLPNLPFVRLSPRACSRTSRLPFTLKRRDSKVSAKEFARKIFGVALFMQ